MFVPQKADVFYETRIESKEDDDLARRDPLLKEREAAFHEGADGRSGARGRRFLSKSMPSAIVVRVEIVDGLEDARETVAELSDARVALEAQDSAYEARLVIVIDMPDAVA